MSKMKALFISSLREFRNLRSLTLMAMFGAISIVIGLYLTFMPTQTIKVTFNFLPNEFVYYLFGPAAGSLFAIAMDLLTFMVRPMGSFFIGFTISAAITGLIYGSILYKKPLSLKRIFIAKVIHMILINLLLNTYWLSIMYGNAFVVLFPARLIKSLIMLPIETILLFSLIKAVSATGVLKLLRRKEA